MEMITPPQLKEGDSVYILSTARKISKEELDPAIQELESWGLTIVLGKSIGASDDQFAGNDQLRITDFNTAIHDSKVKAIICLGKNNEALFDAFGNMVDVIIETQYMSEAVKIAYNVAVAGEAVLLSPACASFDLFESYEDRGKQFKSEVRKL